MGAGAGGGGDASGLSDLFGSADGGGGGAGSADLNLPPVAPARLGSSTPGVQISIKKKGGKAVQVEPLAEARGEEASGLESGLEEAQAPSDAAGEGGADGAADAP